MPNAPSVALRKVRVWSCALTSAGITSLRGPAGVAASGSTALMSAPAKWIRALACAGWLPGAASNQAQSMKLLGVFKAVLGTSHCLEEHVLCSLPQHGMAERAQMILAFDYGQKVVASQRPHLAGETAGAIGQDNFGLAETTGIEQHIAYRGMAGVILITHAELEITQRNPAAFATPANVNELLPVGQQIQKSGNRLRRLRVGFCDKAVTSGSDGDAGHEYPCEFRVSVPRTHLAPAMAAVLSGGARWVGGTLTLLSTPLHLEF